MDDLFADQGDLQPLLVMMKKQRLRLILIVALLLFSIWLAWPDTDSSESPNSSANSEQGNSSKRIGWHLLGFGESDKKGRLNRTQSDAQTAMKRIDRLITHQTLSNQEVAEQLLKIANDKNAPEQVRAEALEHGVILDLPVFVHMAADAQLPEEMAEDLFQHVVNENGNPELQIRAYLDFLSHPSPEIREESMRLLAFMLEDDLGEADEATLRQMADAKLKQLESEKPRKE